MIELKITIFKEAATEWIIYSTLALTVLFSQYFDLIGFSPVQIGILVATMPTVSLISNPFWFKISESIGKKKTACLVSVSAAVLIWLIFVLDGFIPKLVSLALAGFFLSAVLPITENRVVISVKSKGGRFDHARLWGTVGYSVMAITAGFSLRLGLFSIFALLSSVAAIAFVMNLFVIKDADIMSKNIEKKQKVNMGPRNGSPKEFLIMIIPAALALSLVGFISAFLPVYINRKGFDISSVGLTFSIMAFCEVPFLFFAEKIISKIGNVKLLISGMFFLGLRTFLIPVADSFFALLLVQMIHGWNYIVIYFSLFNYIHYKLPEKYSTKAQAVFWMVAQGLSFFMGSVFGGLFVDSFGLEASFSYFGVFGMLLTIPLAIYLYVKHREEKNNNLGEHG